MYVGPGQLNISERVTACIALTSADGVDGSFLLTSDVCRDCLDIRMVIQTWLAATLPLR